MTDELTITEEDVATVATSDPPPEPAVVRDDGDSSQLVFVLAHECWFDGEKYDAGLYRIADPDDELVRFASHAHAAGVAEVSRGLDLSGVESQEDGEEAYAAAQGEPDSVTGRYTGPWIVGHDAQAVIGEANARLERAETDEERESAHADLVRVSAEIDERLREASAE